MGMGQQLILLVALLASLTKAQTSNTAGASRTTPTHMTPIEIHSQSDTDDHIFTDYMKRADELYVGALTDYFTAHPDRLEAELSGLTSPEYEAIPSSALDSFHLDRIAIEAKIHANDERIMNEMEAAMEMEQADADADADTEVDAELEPEPDDREIEISQRGGTGMRRGRFCGGRWGRGRFCGGPRYPDRPRPRPLPRRCVYYRGRRRCPPFVMVPADSMMDDVDEESESGEGPMMIILPLRSRRMWMILMRRRYGPFWWMRGRMGRGMGRGMGMGMGMGRAGGRFMGRGMDRSRGFGRGRGLGAGLMRGGGGARGRGE